MKISYKIILVGLLSIFLSLSFLQCDPLCEGSPIYYIPTEYDDEGRVKKADIIKTPYIVTSRGNCDPYKDSVRVYSYYANGNIKTEIDYKTDEIEIVNIECYNIDNSKDQCHPLTHNLPNEYTSLAYYDSGKTKLKSYIIYRTPEKTSIYIEYTYYESNGNLKTEIDYVTDEETDEIYIKNIECYNTDNSKDQCHPLTHNLPNEYTSLAYYDSGKTKLKSYIIYRTPAKTRMYIEYTYYESNGNLKTETNYYDEHICYDTDGTTIETCSMIKHGVE